MPCRVLQSPLRSSCVVPCRAMPCHAGGLLFAIFITSLFLFFTSMNYECNWCEKVNCLDLAEGFCASHDGRNGPFSI